MPAILEIDEVNGAAGTVTHAITNMATGGVDSPNLIPGPNTAIVAGAPSYAKYHQGHFTDLGTASRVTNLRFWLSAPPTIEKYYTTAGMFPYLPATYSGPRRGLSGVAATEVPLADPGVGTVGVGGNIEGSVTVSQPTTDLWAWYVQTQPGRAGVITTKHFVFAWDEQ